MKLQLICSRLITNFTKNEISVSKLNKFLLQSGSYHEVIKIIQISAIHEFNNQNLWEHLLQPL